MPLRERLGLRPRSKSHLPDPPPPPSSTVAAASPGAGDSPGANAIAERLWNQAYDELKSTEPSVVDGYEKILSRMLVGKGVGNDDDGVNRIAQADVSERRRQMLQVVDAGLKRTAKEAKIKEKTSDVMKFVNGAKDTVKVAIQNSPQAALPWACVVVGLEIIMNPLKQTKDNRDGIEYARKRMAWYWELPKVLLARNGNDGIQAQRLAGLQYQLELGIVDLYKKLLRYEMKSILCYFRNRGVVFLRDMVKLDEWKAGIDDIRQAEDVFKSDTGIYTNQDLSTHLRQLARLQLTEQDNQCIRDLHLTDPRDDKTRIESTKGGLLKDSFRWILDNADFKTWRDDDESRLLWIKGDPGKGKTMLLCGIIDELEESVGPSDLVSFFFCQATDSRLDNSAAIVRSLIYMLVDQQPALVSHVRKKYDHAGKKLFTDPNAWIALSDILRNILHDRSLERAYLFVDALDECDSGLSDFLDLLVEHVSGPSRAKWIVSSRYRDLIATRLSEADSGRSVRLSLELNADTISSAVETYIVHKVSSIKSIKHDKDVQRQLRDLMRRKADGTFLWVALACQHLQQQVDGAEYDAAGMLQIIDEIPAGLQGLYDRMVEQVQQLPPTDLEWCRVVLSLAVVAFRPIRLSELPVLAGFEHNAKISTMERLVAKCGSFLTVRDEAIYLIHLSAKDHLTSGKTHEFLFPQGPAEVHRSIVTRSLSEMRAVLGRDIYCLERPGIGIEEIVTPSPDPLTAVGYSCVHWMSHIRHGHADSDPFPDPDSFDVDGSISHFLQNDLLYWLEALSLLKAIPEGVVAFTHFCSLLVEKMADCPLLHRVKDAHRFMIRNRWVVEQFPLQTYLSALLFTPTKTLTRQSFMHQEPLWIAAKPQVEEYWDSSIQRIEVDGKVQALTFLRDSSILAAVVNENSIQTWDVTTGNKLREIRGLTKSGKGLSSSWLMLSSDSRTLIVVGGQCLTAWDVDTGKSSWALELELDSVVRSVAFSKELKSIAAAGSSSDILVWDNVTQAQGGQRIPDRILHASSKALFFDKTASVAFSSDSKRMAGGGSLEVNVWDTSTYTLLSTVTLREAGAMTSIAFSPDLQLTASIPDVKRGPISLRLEVSVAASDTTTGKTRRSMQLRGVDDTPTLMQFSEDSHFLATMYPTGAHVWDINTGAIVRTFDFGQWGATMMALSQDLRYAAQKFAGGEVEIRTSTPACNLFARREAIGQVVISNDATLVASWSEVGTLCELWDAAEASCLLSFSAWNVVSMTFTKNLKTLIVQTREGERHYFSTTPVAQGGYIDKLKSHLLHLVYFEGYGDDFPEDASELLDLDDGVPDPDYRVDPDGKWITWKGERVIWLPPDYRPSNPDTGWASCGHAIAFSCRGREMVTIHFSGDPR